MLPGTDSRPAPYMPEYRTLRFLLPVLSTALFYALYYAIGALGFDVVIVPKAIPRDYVLNVVVAYALFALSRRAWVFLLLQGLLMAVLYIGNAVKISFFGGPIMPDDAACAAGVRGLRWRRCCCSA